MLPSRELEAARGDGARSLGRAMLAALAGALVLVGASGGALLSASHSATPEAAAPAARPHFQPLLGVGAAALGAGSVIGNPSSDSRVASEASSAASGPCAVSSASPAMSSAPAASRSGGSTGSDLAGFKDASFARSRRGRSFEPALDQRTGGLNARVDGLHGRFERFGDLGQG